MSRKACEVLAEIRKAIPAYAPLSYPWSKMNALVEELQAAVNRLTAAYEVGSEVRCPTCEMDGGMRIVRRCGHCGSVEEIDG